MMFKSGLREGIFGIPLLVVIMYCLMPSVLACESCTNSCCYQPCTDRCLYVCGPIVPLYCDQCGNCPSTLVPCISPLCCKGNIGCSHKRCNSAADCIQPGTPAACWTCGPHYCGFNICYYHQSAAIPPAAPPQPKPGATFIYTALLTIDLLVVIGLTSIILYRTYSMKRSMLQALPLLNTLFKE